jgi:hypothetical protein
MSRCELNDRQVTVFRESVDSQEIDVEDIPEAVEEMTPREILVARMDGNLRRTQALKSSDDVPLASGPYCPGTRSEDDVVVVGNPSFDGFLCST